MAVSFYLPAADLAQVSAILLEVCNLLAVHDVPSRVAISLLSIVSRGLRPSPDASSTSQASHIPNPNTHMLIIRCLKTVPVALWDGQLGEADMGTLMEGLNSPDDTIRRSVSTP